MKLIRVKEPAGEMEFSDTQPIAKNGWHYQGVYVRGAYYERATKGEKVQWFKLIDDCEEII